MKATIRVTAAEADGADPNAPQTRAAQRSETRRRKKSRAHVLLFDADSVSRARFGKSLVQAGVEVTVATTVDEALAAIDDTTIRALVLLTTASDPSVDVVALLEALAASAPELLVVARTHNPGAYELFLRSFGFERTAVIGVDVKDPGQRVREIVSEI